MNDNLRHDLTSDHDAGAPQVGPGRAEPLGEDHHEDVADTEPGERDRPRATDSRPRTGDRAVDDALAAFDRTAAEGPEAHVDAAAEAHRALHSRLTSPPAPTSGPGPARPGQPG